MSAYINTCRHADNVQMMGIRGAERDATCGYISAHISTCGYVHMCWHMSARKYGPNGWYQKWREWFHMLAHVGTCWHISTHVGMSTCADTCQHADKVQMIGITCAEIDVTCSHISAHIGMSTSLTHASMQIRSKWLVLEVSRVMLHVGTYRDMSAHISTYQCVHMCWHTSCSNEIRSKWLVSDVPRMMSHVGTCHISPHVGTYQHMSAHVSTCRHISAHVSMSTFAGTSMQKRFILLVSEGPKLM